MFRSLWSWAQSHPLLAIALAWIAGMFLFLSPFLIRGWRRWRGDLPEQSGWTDDVLDLAGYEADAPWPVQHRIPMHNRFVPDEASGPTRSLALVDQIVADQQQAHEEPGRRGYWPAPGDRGYHPPGQRIRVVVGAFTFVLDRRRPTMLIEASPGGDDYPEVEIPDPWNDVVTVLAFEVQRLREGWSLPEETPA